MKTLKLAFTTKEMRKKNDESAEIMVTASSMLLRSSSPVHVREEAQQLAHCYPTAAASSPLNEAISGHAGVSLQAASHRNAATSWL